MNIVMFMVPIVIFLICEIYCVKMVLPRFDTKPYFHYFDRTTWLWIIILTNVFGYLFYMYFEERDEF